MRLCQSCPPFMAARQAGASLAGSRKRVPSRPTCRAAALIGLGVAVFVNRTLLESTMAQSSPVRISAPSFSLGESAHIQRHADAQRAEYGCTPTARTPQPVPDWGVIMTSKPNIATCAATSSDTKRTSADPHCRPGQAIPFLPCYSCAAAPVKRSRDWRPVESPRRKPWSLFRRVCGFLVCAPVYGGSDGGAKAPPVLAGGSRYANLFEPPPSIGVGRGGFSKPNHLESTMAHSSPGRISAPISLGEIAHIQRHADAHHALNRALYQRCPPQPGGSTASIPSQEASS